MEKVLIVGVSGLVGARIAELEKGNYKIYGTYKDHKVGTKGMFRLDTSNRKAVFSLVERLRPDYIIDTHAISDVDYCELHPEEAWRVNFDGARNVAEASRRQSSKYIFFSTDYVFDGKKAKYTEEDKPHPLNYYAKTKVAAEYMLCSLDIDCIIIRTTTVYGSSNRNKVSFPLWVINRLKESGHVKVVMDQYNKPTFADSLEAFTMKLCERGQTGVFHVTGSELVSRFDLARLTAMVFGLDENLVEGGTTTELDQDAERPKSVNLSTEKAERATGLRPVGLREGLIKLKEQIGI
jgi:dTDP-4-dehydrorhamnose reductase